MIKIKANSKRGKRLIDRFNNSSDYFISDIYKKPSDKKIDAFSALVLEFGFKSRSYRVWGNYFTFSVMFNIYDKYVYITAKNEYIIE